MKRDLYKLRSDNHECVICVGKLPEGHTKKKCTRCLAAAARYKKKTRDKHRARQEREYRSSVWYKRCLYRARKTDEVKNRVEEGPYMTEARLKTLRILQLNKCYYCDRSLQVENRRAPDGLTIERLSNARPHSKANCVLCCHHCNVSRVGDHIDDDIHQAYYSILRKFEQDPVIYKRFLDLMAEARD
jgi:hypothetical protein